MKNNVLKRLGIVLLGAICMLCFAFATLPFFSASAQETMPTGKVELYQLAPGESLYEGYVVKTGDGKLIVIDGGAATKSSPAYIDAALTAISGTENYVVDYWFLSHAHSDHIHELGKILNSETINFTVNNFVFDFPEFVQTTENGAWYTSYSSSCVLSSSDAGGDIIALKSLMSGFNNYAAKKGIAYEGDSYYDVVNGSVVNEEALKNGPIIIESGDVKFEVLQTWSTSDTQVNSHSLIVRMWVDGQSVLFLNDATVESGNRLLRTYDEEFLKSDIVQMAHHGQNGTARNVYDAVQAKVRLWPCHSGIWKNEGGGYQTDEVREWVGLPASAKDFVKSPYDLISGLCDAPTDVTSVPAWTAVLNGMKMELPYIYAYENTFTMKEGASIRLTSGSTGIRFSAELVSYNPNYEYGFAIAPRSWFESLGVTENYVSEIIKQKGEDKIIKLVSRVHQVDKHFEINGSIANILDKNINLDFVGIAYAYDGTNYVDAHFESLDNITRNVAQVATSAYNDELYNDYGYSTDQLDVIKGFINKSVKGEEYYLGFENETVTMTVFEEKTLALNTNLTIGRAKWTSSDQSVVTVKDGKISARGVGQATVTVESVGLSDTCTVTVVGESDAIMSFSSKLTEDSVTRSGVANRSSSYVETEWLESYQGATGVLKVTSYAQLWNPSVADIQINLPVKISSGATLKIWIEECDASNVYFYKPNCEPTNNDLKIITMSGLVEEQKNTWNYYYVNYSSVTDGKNMMNLLIQGGKSGVKHVFYIDEIVEGDTAKNHILDKYQGLMNSLSEKIPADSLYLADFSSDDYEQLVINDTYGRVAESITAERLESYLGNENVMKVTTENNSGSFGDFTLVLPKAMGDTGYTIRFMLAETTSTEALRILNPRTEVGKIKEYKFSVIVGSWVEVFVPYTGEFKNEVTFQIWGNADGVNVFYIDYVADGDVVEEMKNERNKEIIERLPENYLADFSSYSYSEFVVKSTAGSTYAAESVTAEYVAEYKGNKDLIKVTTLNANSGSKFGDFTINLPKAITKGGYTIRFMLESTTSSGPIRIMKPHTSTKIKEYNPASSYAGQWINVYVPYTGEHASEVTFEIYGNADGVNVFYIDAVLDGDQVDALNSSIFGTVADGYLADFSSELYEGMAGINTYGDKTVAKTVTSQCLDKFEDNNGVTYTNLLKVTTESSSSNSFFGDFTLHLPKRMTKGGFTIRFMLESTNAASNLRINNPHTYISYITEYKINDIIGKWQTIYIPYTGDYTNEVTFQLYGTANSRSVFYIDGVWDGDQRANLG